jgi:PKD repeat protein
MISETLAFDDAVRTALAFAAGHPDTLLIVTADHETGGVTRRENSDGTPSFLFTATDHTAADVPIMASGPGADRIGTGTIGNTQVFELMRDAMDLVPVTPTPTSGVGAVPPGTALPTDGDGDGVCEDVNGNGRGDFADVVLFFNQMTWIAANEPVAAFDYNANGRIDFADVVWLFNNL